jgi:hypothetical protein
MAIIPQKILFDWNEIEELDDLERLRLVPTEQRNSFLRQQRFALLAQSMLEKPITPKL